VHVCDDVRCHRKIIIKSLMLVLADRIIWCCRLGSDKLRLCS